jgi:hypothetical protein
LDRQKIINNYEMRKYVFLSIVAFFVGTVLVQNQLNYEKAAILEENFWIAYKYRDIKKGMSKVEVFSILGFPPDAFVKASHFSHASFFENEDGTFSLTWSNSQSTGSLRELLGITYTPKTSSLEMNMHIDFDKDGHVTGVYYGG